MDKPLFYDGSDFYEGDGFGFASMRSFGSNAMNTMSNFGSKALNFGNKAVNYIGKNKDAMAGIANLAEAGKSVFDTVNSTKRANEELRQSQIKFDNEVNMYQKIIDQQNELKKLKAENEKKKLQELKNKEFSSKSETSNFAKTEIPKLIPSYVDKKIINEDQPITYTTNTDTKSKNSSLNESQLEAIRNMNKRGEGMKKKSNTQKVGKGLRIY
jgi:predicted O-linked N-acetylglucosamine transferase (SPINDLY family)